MTSEPPCFPRDRTRAAGFDPVSVIGLFHGFVELACYVGDRFEGQRG